MASEKDTAGPDAYANKPSSDSEVDVEQGVPEKPQGPPPGAFFDPRENPDGGRQAWLCLLGGFCVLFSSFGWINCVGVFQAYYQEHQLSSYSPSTVAWISSLTVFFMFFFGPVIGKVYDNYGPRYLLLVGTFLEVFGLMMTSLCTEYYQFILAQGICASTGASILFYPAMSSVTTWFYKKRGAAFGAIAAGSSLGGVILPIMVQKLIPEVGFPWAMRATAFLLLFMLIIANLTITSRMKHVVKPVDIMEFIRPLKEVVFDLTVAGAFLFFMGMFLPISFIILEGEHYGIAYSLAQYLVPILNAASFFGRTIPGFLADKIGRFNMMIIMDAFTAIIVLALWVPGTSHAAIITFAAFFGFGSGAFVSLLPSMIAQISDVRQIGVRTGTIFAIISIAALISTPIGGAIIQHDKGSYLDLKIYTGCMLAGGTFFMILARIKQTGFKLMTKV